MTAASRKQLARVRPATFPSTPKMNRPVSSTVTSTPTVESKIPCRRMGRVSLKEVSRPAENRMMVIAKCPMDSAT